MVIKSKDIDIAVNFFATTPEHQLEPVAAEMNKKHSALPSAFMALEQSGIDGHIVDELMLGTITIWYVVEKIKYKRIEVITEQDVQKGYELFSSFIGYFNKAEQSEIKTLGFFKYEKDLEQFTLKLLIKLYGSIKNIPQEVIFLYFSIMKCFESKLEYTRKRK